MPDVPLSPLPGCHVDELHMWAKRMFNQVDAAVQSIAKEQNVQRVKLDKLADAANLSDDNARRLKGIESGAERAMARANEAVEIAQKNIQDGATAIHSLRGELSGFAKALEASSQHLAAVEAEYRSHVSNNFQALEIECRELRAMSTFAAASVTAAAPLGHGSASSGHTDGVNPLDFTLMKSKVDAMEQVLFDVTSRVQAADSVGRRSRSSRSTSRSRHKDMMVTVTVPSEQPARRTAIALTAAM